MSEAIDILRALIGFDTQNWGSGHSAGERACGEWIAATLRDAGYEPVLLAREDAPERLNVVVRIEGREPVLRGLVVHAHTDVVPAEPEQWASDPFTAEIRDGWIIGRGATDMKDMCAQTLTVLLQWAREGVRPRRTIVVAFVADEEDAGAYGAEWLVAEHPDLFDGCAAAIGEEGAQAIRVAAADGRAVRLYQIAAGERGTMHIKITARGASGHASRPTGEDAVHRLIEVLHRIATHRWPLRPCAVVREQVSRTSAALGLGVTDPASEEGIAAVVAALGEFAGPLPYTIRASATPTMLAAGYKVNVVPGVATAEVDVRCPPGCADEVDATLAELIGDLAEWEHTTNQSPIEAPVDSPWFTAMRDAVLAHDPDGVVVPFCMGGGTDAKAFAKLGMACYGFTPLLLDDAGRRPTGIHGVDERNGVWGIEAGVPVLRSFLES